jgi:ankyrin repeat protein
MDRELVGDFIDAVATEPEKALGMLAGHPDLKSARWIHGESPLHFLAIEGTAEAVAFLADAGFDLEATNEFGDTALIDAVTMGRADVVKVLLDEGANPNCLSNTMAFPLHHAMVTGRIEIVRMLLAAGADPRLRGPYGETLSDIFLIVTQPAMRSQLADVLKERGFSLSDFE